jgi:peptide/nickel transport system substrate-binding protein
MLIVVYAVCILSATQIFGQTSTLRYVETSKPDILNPIEGSRDIVGVRIMELVYRGLVAKNRKGDWEAEIAKEVPSFIPGLSEIIVELDPGLKWPDGASLTAHDVAFSFNVYKDPDNSYGNINILEVFDKVEAVNNSTVRFVLNYSTSRAISRMGFSLMPQHMLKNTFIDPSLRYNEKPMGSGPYKINRSEDDGMEFELNPHYPRSKPSIDKIELMLNPDEDIHKAFLISGSIDLDPVVRPHDIPAIVANTRTGLEPYDSNEWFGFAFNCQNEFLRFKEIRQALTYLFDRKDALDAHFLNKGSLISGPYTLSSFGYNPDVELYRYNPNKGDEILKSLGFVDSQGDGKRDLNGKPMVFKMVLDKSMRQENKNVCAAFREQMAEFDIEIRIDWKDHKTWQEEIFFNRNYDITFMGWKFDDGSNIYPLFSSAEMLAGQYNVVQFSHDEVDNLLNEFRMSTDNTERTEISKRLHVVLREESPYLFLWSLQYNAGIRLNRIRKILIDPFNFFGFINTWRMQ